MCIPFYLFINFKTYFKYNFVFIMQAEYLILILVRFRTLILFNQCEDYLNLNKSCNEYYTLDNKNKLCILI